MDNTNTTETEIAAYARRTAKTAGKLRKAGRHTEANALVTAAAAKVEWYRSHRKAGGAI